jgi:site-specific DNA-adenine methylase
MPSIVATFVDLRNVHPFIKWAGGKSQLLSELDKMIPHQFNKYFEPFRGGGAMFFYLMSRGIRFNACLSDINGELITAYTAVKDNVKEVHINPAEKSNQYSWSIETTVILFPDNNAH